MIKPDGTAKAHVPTQELNQQLISAGTQRHWVDRRKPPVLPLRSKIVRRRSAIGVQRHHRLIHPRLGSCPFCAEREIVVNADWHAGGFGRAQDFAELFGRDPLNVLEEANPLSMTSAIFTRRRTRREKLLRPFLA